MQTNRQTDIRHELRHTAWLRKKRADKQAYRQTDRSEYKQTDIQTDKHTKRQTDA